jgi:hypothetical protein
MFELSIKFSITYTGMAMDGQHCRYSPHSNLKYTPSLDLIERDRLEGPVLTETPFVDCTRNQNEPCRKSGAFIFAAYGDPLITLGIHP